MRASRPPIRQRQLEPQIVGAGIGSLPAHLNAALERLVALHLIEHVGRTRVYHEAIVGAGRMCSGATATAASSASANRSEPGNGRAIEVSVGGEASV